MKQKTHQILFGLALLIVMPGCTSQGMSLTLAADHHVKGTQFHEVQMTASVQAGRMQSTQDFYTTQVAFSSTQSQFLEATLVARGTDLAVINDYQAQLESGGLSLPTRTPRPSPTFAPLIPPTPFAGAPISDPVSAEVQGNIVSTANASSAAVPPTSGPRLVNLMTAPGVTDTDCAENATTVFSTSTTEIYIVATAYEVTSGMKMESIWEISGEERTFDFTPDFDIDGECVWFYIDQSEFLFQPGSARVSLSLDGTQMGVVEFTVQ